MNLSEYDDKDLLRLNSRILKELKSRGIIRTFNNPLGDYTEWLVSTRLDYTLENNSKAGFDATSKTGERIQIKGRRVTPTNNSRQLSAIRNLSSKDFDILAAVIFDEDYNVIEAKMIPQEIIHEYANYREHVNAHILILKGDILSDNRIKDIKKDLI
ncbi:MAG: hypothetical protein PQJ59_13765 [Spirochaetales bacterium]|nr:hypothetical protein [Spirochaetales bacterium]